MASSKRGAPRAPVVSAASGRSSAAADGETGGAAPSAATGGAGGAGGPGDVLVSFVIHYATKPGEQLLVTGSSAALGTWAPHRALHLAWVGHGWWSATVAVPRAARSSEGGGLEYKYLVRHEDGNLQWEAGANRAVDLAAVLADAVELRDEWKVAAGETELYHRSAFTDVVFCRDPADRRAPAAWALGGGAGGKVAVRFQAVVPRVEEKHGVFVCGEHPQLGAFDPDRALALSDADFPCWAGNAEFSEADFPIRYKLIIRAVEGRDTDDSVWWEYGDERTLELDHTERSTVVAAPAKAAARAGGRLLVPTIESFRMPGRRWRGAGVAIPVFSLRSAEGMGVGEFNDICGLVDWAKRVGIRMVQILPINDTCVYGTWRDSYPYNSVSVFALHPIYINIRSLGDLPDELAAKVDEAYAQLNAEPAAPLDYEAVMGAKLPLLRDIFKVLGAATLEDAEFKEFFEANKDWLQPYALFCTLRDLTGVADPQRWGKRSTITMKEVEELTAPGTLYYDAVAFWYFVQFHLHRQLLAASEYAKSNNVVIKGDLPIGVARFGVDAWMYPHLFHMDTQTGAPPDYFATLGQNWGFPTYNWEEMSKDNYAWWRRRLSSMAVYFQAYRIDHILGFFRIWSIPEHGVSGLLGRFSPATPLWRGELEENGLWDLNRLTEPYIRDHLIGQSFGVHYHEAKDTYFDYHGYGVFTLKEAYSTEKKIAEALPADEDEWRRIALMRLRCNVVLLKDEHDGNQFHPRIEMEKTSSFQELPDADKATLKRLYVDYFFKRQEGLWREKAMSKLPVMKGATNMLVCGEDLGMVPDCVSGVMSELSLLSLRVQRMPADPKQEFGNPAEYDYFSVCTTSSHDTSTLRGWWEEDAEVTQSFYNTILLKPGAAPATCEPDLAWSVLEQHLYCESMWAVFPIQDWLAIDAGLRNPDAAAERINEPANPMHYWRWRLHLSLDELNAADDFNANVRALVRDSGRYTAYVSPK